VVLSFVIYGGLEYNRSWRSVDWAVSGNQDWVDSSIGRSSSWCEEFWTGITNLMDVSGYTGKKSSNELSKWPCDRMYHEISRLSLFQINQGHSANQDDSS